MSAPTTAPYRLGNTTTQGLAMPGAYLVNGSYGAFPIYFSVGSYSTYYMNNCDDGYWVMPNFRIIVYANDGYSSQTYDSGYNRYGYPVYYSLSGSAVNNGQSCYLYYNTTSNDLTGYDVAGH
jgi:hypothetical protein